MKMLVWFVFALGALSAAGKVVTTNKGSTVTLECGPTSFSKSLEWQHLGKRIFQIDGRSGFQRKGIADIMTRSKIMRQTQLQISSVKEEDAGHFKCLADGRSEDITLVVVSVSVSPNPSAGLQPGSEATLQCQVKGLGGGLTVQWKKPDGETLAQEAVNLQPVARTDAGTWKCVFQHGGQDYDQDLEIRVAAPPTQASPLDPVGKASEKPGQPNCVHCDTSKTPRMPLGLSWWMWAVIGAGCLVVVLLMVFVIVLSKRIKRKKRKLQMRNGRQPPRPRQYCQCNRPTAAAKSQQGCRREKPSAPPLHPLLME